MTSSASYGAFILCAMVWRGLLWSSADMGTQALCCSREPDCWRTACHMEIRGDAVTIMTR